MRLDHVSKPERDKLFRRMDNNGSGTLSLAEIDKATIELWPSLNHKKPLMRACKNTSNPPVACGCRPSPELE